ncbi:hypothetical protein FACS1894158_18500 [Betaproteobacteria bacterium]|nr:hypothetical protein FACS1894158_18500 [Betaproteobacteria bacterium]
MCAILKALIETEAHVGNPMAIMKSTAQTPFAERAGRTLGRMWRGCERRAAGAMAAHGLPRHVVTVLLWIIKLALLGTLLYVAFWVGLLLLFAVTGAWLLRNDDGSYDEEHRPKWEYGLAGYGLYSHDGQRIDPHDPDDEQD